MFAILVTAAWLCAICFALQAGDDDCVYPSVQEVVCGKANDSIRSLFAPSMYDCAGECKVSPMCLSFTFDPEKRACQLLKKEYPSFTVGKGNFFSNIQEWKMQLTGACRNASCGPNSRCTVGRNGHPVCLRDVSIGMECTNDDGCHVTMTTCFLGRCQCLPGYSHNIRRDSCDRDCKNYGDTMTPYKGLGIKGHNTKRVTLVGDAQTIEMCMLACVQETSFVCKTIDFREWTWNCHLSSVGFLDVTVAERERGLSSWWFAMRKCQE